MWHHLYIDHPTDALHRSRLMMRSVMSAVLVGRNDVALFSRLDDHTGGMHYHFSPAAKSIALSYGATPCPIPSKAEAGGLLAGVQGAVPLREARACA